MQRYNRMDRVSNLLHREISEIIEHEVKDDRLGMVTVTGVDVSKDMKYAKVYFSVLGDAEVVKNSLAALQSAAAFMRSRLVGRVILRNIPSLTFEYDPSTEYGVRINKILNDLRKDET